MQYAILWYLTVTGKCLKIFLLLNKCVNNRLEVVLSELDRQDFGKCDKLKQMLSIGSYILTHMVLERRCESTLKISGNMETEFPYMILSARKVVGKNHG